MATLHYVSVSGIVQNISAQSGNCCNLQVSLLTQNGIVNLNVSPDTYVVNNLRIVRGMSLIAFYDGDAPAPLIFPPQFRALVVAQKSPRENVVLDFFDRSLTARDNSLQLNVSPSTAVTTANGQPYSCSLQNQTLLVYYTATTRSIPPQTTPRRIIVMCQ